VAAQSIVCDFDKADRLVGCRPWEEAYESQEIPLTDFEALTEGETAEAIVSHLCSPGRKDDGSGGEQVFEYLVLRPTARFNRVCPAYLHLTAGRLTKKEIVCR
jgi:hypothetical protein